jgi:CBS domain containing-hemolysin-like protein
MILLLIYLFIALFISFFCSIMEAVLLSTSHSFLIVKLELGKSWAKHFISLKSNIDKPLSAILSLNTVAHTVGAAGVGAQAVKVFGEPSFGIVSAILTLLILVFTEIIPKTIGARYWRGLAWISAYTIRGMIIISYPLVIMSAVITRVFTKRGTKHTASREEVSALAGIGVDEGIFHEKEYKIIHNLVRLKDVRVSEIMTPRVVLTTADENLYLKDFLQDIKYLKFSRIPVYSGEFENISGYVFRQTVFEKLADDQFQLKLKDLKREIVIVPASQVLFDVWEILIEKREHIALVVDEYGGIDGIVTMEDIIETLLGLEIIDEKDTIVDMQKYARERWYNRQVKYNLLDQLNKENDNTP